MFPEELRLLAFVTGLDDRAYGWKDRKPFIAEEARKIMDEQFSEIDENDLYKFKEQ